MPTLSSVTSSVSLADAVDTLDRRVPTEAPPVAFVLDRGLDGWAVARTLDPAQLVGWTAPASCWAVALVAGGRARPAGPHRDPTTSDRAAEVRRGAGGPAVRVTVAVGRDGATSGRITSAEVRIDEAPAGGRMLDVLHRSLGLATPAPAEDTRRLLATLWLAAIADAGGTARRWSQVARLHPAVGLLADRGSPLAVADIDAVLDVAAPTWSWEVLRRAEAARTSPSTLCPVGHAGWWDAGSYARRVLDGLPPLGEVWAAAADGLTPTAGQRLTAVLHRQGLDVAARWTAG